MKLPTLFAYNAKGKPLQWVVRAEKDKIIVTHGQVGGKQVDQITTAKGKNIGKANETTPEEQAIKEAQAKWRFQIDREDYNEDIEKSGLQLRPMLALDYNKVPHRVDWGPAVVQPKLDGLRLTVGNRYVPGGYTPGEFEMLTRKGEVYHVPHLIEPCNKLLEIINNMAGVNGRCLALDGEAYIHGVPLQRITSLARKYQEGETEKLEFHLFDLVMPGHTFEARHAYLGHALRQLNEQSLVFVDYTIVKDEQQMKLMHGFYTQQGYEGLMIRHAYSEYDIAKRSPNLFKYKHFMDKECLVVDVWEDKNGNAMFSCMWDVNDDNSMFKCTPKRTHEVRKEMLKNKDDYIGKWVTVKYQALTEDNLPQFPVGLDLRECNENGEPLV